MIEFIGYKTKWPFLKFETLNLGKKLAYFLICHPDVEKVDLPRIDEKYKSMIKGTIEERLKTQPEIYGKPLQRTLKGYWKLRGGEFRVVFKVFGNELRIYGIIHRKRVYRDIGKKMT